MDNHFGGKLKDKLVRSRYSNIEKIILTLEKKSSFKNAEIQYFKDSVVYFSDSEFVDLEFGLNEISKIDYQNAQKNYKTSCAKDTNGFVKGKGLIIGHYCEEVCDTYLIDKKTKIKLLLPSSYDQGIMGLLISPKCNQFIVFSSYDGSDYTDFYDFRAEIFGFTITKEQGLQAVKPAFMMSTKDWSMEEVIWISENEIAIKAYKENRNLSNEDCLDYTYFKVGVNKRD